MKPRGQQKPRPVPVTDSLHRNRTQSRVMTLPTPNVTRTVLLGSMSSFRLRMPCRSDQMNARPARAAS